MNPQCASAYGLDDDPSKTTTFEEIDSRFGRLGWSNGAYDMSSDSFTLLVPLYADAEDYNVSKATQRGSALLTVSGGGSTLSIAFDAQGSGLYEEYNIYVGDTILPLDAEDKQYVNPDRYAIAETAAGAGEEQRTITVDISGLDTTGIYFIAQLSAVCSRRRAPQW